MSRFLINRNWVSHWQWIKSISQICMFRGFFGFFFSSDSIPHMTFRVIFLFGTESCWKKECCADTMSLANKKHVPLGHGQNGLDPGSHKHVLQHLPPSEKLILRVGEASKNSTGMMGGSQSQGKSTEITHLLHPLHTREQEYYCVC